jgi:hypothetical protein
MLPNVLCGNETSEKQKIIGFWTTSFPVTRPMYGYIFDDDGRFYYWDESDYNIKNQYDGSIGTWKIEKNKIMIKIEYNLVWKLKWVVINGKNEPGKTNARIFIKNKKTHWLEIGDLRLFSEAQTYVDGNNSSSRPDTISLKPIMNKEIVESERFFGRICVFNKKGYEKLCEYPNNIIRAYKKLMMEKK